MPFPPQRDHRIPLQAAAALTRRYRNGRPSEAEKAVMFSRDAFERLLGQPGASGIRFYYGQEEGGAISLIAVAVDQDGNDIASGELDEFGYPCPPFCSGENDLNS